MMIVKDLRVLISAPIFHYDSDHDAFFTDQEIVLSCQTRKFFDEEVFRRKNCLVSDFCNEEVLWK